MYAGASSKPAGEQWISPGDSPPPRGEELCRWFWQIRLPRTPCSHCWLVRRWLHIRRSIAGAKLKSPAEPIHLAFTGAGVGRRVAVLLGQGQPKSTTGRVCDYVARLIITLIPSMFLAAQRQVFDQSVDWLLALIRDICSALTTWAIYFPLPVDLRVS